MKKDFRCMNCGGSFFAEYDYLMPPCPYCGRTDVYLIFEDEEKDHNDWHDGVES